MATRDSKRALAQVAELLGTDPADARAYLRQVQRSVGPVSYQAILRAMTQVEDHTVENVAARVRALGPTPDG